ncbi:RING finger protein 148-like [Glandiceps talaboti]
MACDGSNASVRDFNVDVTASFNISYIDSNGHVINSEELITVTGQFGTGTVQPVDGLLILSDPHDSCSTLGNKVNSTWIAFVIRGECPFTDKVTYVTECGASAMLLQNDVAYQSLFTMDYTGTLPAVMISYEDGQYIRSKAEEHQYVWLEIRVGHVIKSSADRLETQQRHYILFIFCMVYVHGVVKSTR